MMLQGPGAAPGQLGPAGQEQGHRGGHQEDGRLQRQAGAVPCPRHPARHLPLHGDAQGGSQ